MMFEAGPLRERRGSFKERTGSQVKSEAIFRGKLKSGVMRKIHGTKTRGIHTV